MENFGYAEYYPLETLDDEYLEGFECANYFGYEDDIIAWRARVNAIYEGKIVAG